MKVKMKEVNKMSKMKKIHENYTGTIARMDEEGNLEFDFMDDFGSHPVLGEYDPDEARALADAIYNELGLGWLPWSNEDNEPDFDMLYDVTFTNWEGELATKTLVYQADLWKTMRVIAYRERPKPYQPESDPPDNSKVNPPDDDATRKVYDDLDKHLPHGGSIGRWNDRKPGEPQ